MVGTNSDGTPTRLVTVQESSNKHLEHLPAIMNIEHRRGMLEAGQMTGEKSLDVLLAHMDAQVRTGVFVFVTCRSDTWPKNLNPAVVVQEEEGTTLILPKREAEETELRYTFPCRMITLSVHSALDAVGFIAEVATALAKAGMGVNPVAGFFHDHLFVPDGREEDAMRVLEKISHDARRRLHDHQPG